MRRQHVDREHLEAREACLDRLGDLVEDLERKLPLESHVEGVVRVRVALPARGPALDHLLDVAPGPHEAKVHVGGRAPEDHAPRVLLGTEGMEILLRLHRDEVREVRVGLDAPGHDDLAGGVDHAPRLEAVPGQAEGNDALPLDGHVPSPDALRRHHVASTNQEIQHGQSSPIAAAATCWTGTTRWGVGSSRAII